MTEKPSEAPMLALIETPDNPTPSVVDQASIVLLDAQKFDRFYDKVKGETAAHVPDVSSAAGREAIRSLAFRVTKTATSLDKSALELTEAWRKQTKSVNDARKPMVERLKTLAAEVRRPLTEWEDAEQARLDANTATLDGIRADATITPEDTAESVATRGRAVWAMTFEAPQWGDEQAAEAQSAKEATVAALVAAQKRLAQEEADRAELEELRKEREARRLREEQEEAERLERELAEQAEREAREVEEQRVRDEEARIQREAEEAAERERAEAQRIADAEAAAEQRARDEAERVSREAQEAREAEHAAEVAAERKRAEDAERIAQEERDARAAEIAAEAANNARLAEEAAAVEREAQQRAKNKAHRTAIMSEAKLALMGCGIDEDAARVIVLAIIAGNVPHVALSW